MVIAIAAIEVRTEHMQSDIAAALVGAGLLSVLLFSAIASALLSRIDRSSSTSQRGNEREEMKYPVLKLESCRQRLLPGDEL